MCTSAVRCCHLHVDVDINLYESGVRGHALPEATNSSNENALTPHGSGDWPMGETQPALNSGEGGVANSNSSRISASPNLW